jgi:putative peptidoglycan lipid II flippase
LGIPATVALVFLSEALITTLFFYGEMTQRDVNMASLALSAYGVGLFAQMLVKILLPGYFARQDTSTPVRYGVIALVSNMVLNLILIWHLHHVGLALATSLSGFLNAGLLFFGLKKIGVLQLDNGWPRFLVQVLAANLVMFVAIYLLTPDQWFGYALLERIGLMLLICSAGALIYGACLLLVGVRIRQMVR